MLGRGRDENLECEHPCMWYVLTVMESTYQFSVNRVHCTA